ncbi:MAG: hypothetical protein JWM87_1764 [Candidatus Eremiobacteraeota bacterium]|nr:hypothetical protein [Candidatus Eremiobacteraeota bacterium]
MRLLGNSGPDVDQLRKIARGIALDEFGLAHVADVELDRSHNAFTHLFDRTADDTNPRQSGRICCPAAVSRTFVDHTDFHREPFRHTHPACR